MILLDYSAVAIAAMMISIRKEKEQLTEAFALHMILNSIRTANKKLSNDFGKMVICCDSENNWRKKVFPLYKYKRNKKKKNDDIDWDLVYRCLDYVKNEIRDGFPYLVVEVNGAEADDIIGALANHATFIQEPTVIVSNDKDFVQRHSEYVCQFRPSEQAFFRDPEPHLQLRELLIRGDADDGIPNIRSQDDIFAIDDKQQSRIYAKEVDVWIYDEELSFLDDETRPRYERNKKLIDLDNTPEYIKEDAVRTVLEDGDKRANKSKMTKFFMKNRLRHLHERINDFM